MTTLVEYEWEQFHGEEHASYGALEGRSPPDHPWGFFAYSRSGKGAWHWFSSEQELQKFILVVEFNNELPEKMASSPSVDDLQGYFSWHLGGQIASKFRWIGSFDQLHTGEAQFGRELILKFLSQDGQQLDDHSFRPLQESEIDDFAKFMNQI